MTIQPSHITMIVGAIAIGTVLVNLGVVLSAIKNLEKFRLESTTDRAKLWEKAANNAERISRLEGREKDGGYEH